MNVVQSFAQLDITKCGEAYAHDFEQHHVLAIGQQLRKPQTTLKYDHRVDTPMSRNSAAFVNFA